MVQMTSEKHSTTANLQQVQVTWYHAKFKDERILGWNNFFTKSRRLCTVLENWPQSILLFQAKKWPSKTWFCFIFNTFDLEGFWASQIIKSGTYFKEFFFLLFSQLCCFVLIFHKAYFRALQDEHWFKVSFIFSGTRFGFWKVKQMKASLK